MKEIVYGWNYRDWGGAQRYFLSLIPEASKHYKISIALPDGSSAAVIAEAERLGASVHFIPGQFDLKRDLRGIQRSLQRFSKIAADFRFIKAIYKKFDPKVSILHLDLGFWNSYWIVSMLALRFNVFFTIHTPIGVRSGLRANLWRLKGRTVGRLPTMHFLSSNRAAKDSLESFIPAEKYENVVVVYSGASREEIDSVIKKGGSRETVRRGIGIGDSDFLIVLVGQFIERKGSRVLLEALPELTARIKNLHVVWLTMNSPDPAMAKQVAEATARGSFRLIDGNDVGGRAGVLEIQWAADLFILPSLEEGLPMALIEAMFLGRPCIASDVGAVSEAIEHNVSGKLVPAGDLSALIDEITNLSRDSRSAKAFGASAREKAIRDFDMEEAAKVNTNAYSAALK